MFLLIWHWTRLRGVNSCPHSHPGTTSAPASTLEPRSPDFGTLRSCSLTESFWFCFGKDSQTVWEEGWSPRHGRGKRKGKKQNASLGCLPSEGKETIHVHYTWDLRRWENGARIILLWQMDVDFPLKEQAGKEATTKIYLWTWHFSELSHVTEAVWKGWVTMLRARRIFFVWWNVFKATLEHH